MNKPKIALGLVGVLAAGVVFAETPLVNKFEEVIDSGIDIVFDFEELINEEELPLEEIKIDDVEATDTKEVSLNDSLLAAKDIAIRQEIAVLKNIFEERGFLLTDIKSQLVKYAKVSSEYNLSEDEREYLHAALEEYENTELVFKTFEFLKMTPYSLDAISDIYAMVESENMSVEEAYSIYSGKQSEELTVDDVAYYVGQGISVDDILAMYEVSLGCSEGLRTMLNSRVEGESWCEIISNSYELGESFARLDYEPRSILSGIITARKLNIPFSEIAVLSTEDSLVAEEFSEKLIAQKLAAFEFEEKPNSFYGLEASENIEKSEPLFIDGETNIKVEIYSAEDLYEDEITEIPADDIETDL